MKLTVILILVPAMFYASGCTSNKPTESQDELYNRFIRDGLIFGRNQGNRIVYKGPDLTDEDIQKLTQSMANKGFVLSRENLDYRKGDKLIYKRD